MNLNLTLVYCPSLPWMRRDVEIRWMKKDGETDRKDERKRERDRDREQKQQK